jgi:ribosome-binding protein aMBF1 (putative translation factor)
MNKCGDCIRFEECKPYVTENECFPEMGGCKAFKKKAGAETMPETFADRLRAIRKSQGLKQYELAEKIGICKVHLSMYERGVISPTITTLEWICKALDVSATELLGW